MQKQIIHLSIAFYLLLTTFCLNAQPEPGMPNEPGKCYAKCLISEAYHQDTLIAYYSASENIDNYFDHSIDTVQTKEVSNWRKINRVSDCLSADPDDCLQWQHHINAANEIGITIPLLNDKLYHTLLTQPGALQIQVLAITSNQEVADRTEWREVLCGDHPDAKVAYSKAFDILNNIGYSTSSGDEQKKSLVQFQKDYGLPIGQLDIETLACLDQIDKKAHEQFMKEKALKYISFFEYDRPKPDTFLIEGYRHLANEGGSEQYRSKLEYQDLNYLRSNTPNLVVENKAFNKALKKHPEHFEYVREEYIVEPMLQRNGYYYIDQTNDHYSEVLQAVIRQLKVEGLLDPDNDDNNAIYAALVSYQQQHRLPAGVLDIKTLTSLGIDYFSFI